METNSRKTRKNGPAARRGPRRTRAAKTINLSKLEWEQRIRRRLENVSWERLRDEIERAES